MFVVQQALWDAEVAHSGHYDKIAVENLEVVVNAGSDVWGRPKRQRAHISITVILEKAFTSASLTDSVDESTVHYGTLSKAIQTNFQDATSEQTSTAALSSSIHQCVHKLTCSTSIYAIETNVCYQKASMFGDAAGHISSIIKATELRTNVLYLRNLRVPCIIGVNPNERLQKQPVILNVWVDGVADSRLDDYSKLETLLFLFISESSFQTIESLLSWLIEKLKQNFFTRDEDQDSWIKLRIAKPLAVPFADAPAVEITRPVRST